MRWLYSLLLFLLLPLLFLRLLIRSFRQPAYRKRWGERLALYQTKPVNVDFWLHAVSLGEVIAAGPLIESLLAKKYTVCITTMTPTGSARVRESFGARVSHVYLPFDLAYLHRRFLAHYLPKQCIIMETELWPNLIIQVAKKQVPVTIINARLSEKSFKGYSKIKCLLGPMFDALTTVAAQSVADSERFIGLGLAKEKVKVMGNLKFDIAVEPAIQQAAKQQATALSRPIWIAASTHPNEEAIILKAHQILLNTLPNALLILAPRHPERFDEVGKLISHHDFTLQRHSEKIAIKKQCQVFLVDALGQLMHYYALAEVAFVGGSLVPHGGHNMLEPIATKTPVISGVHTHNFKAITKLLLDNQAIKLVATQNELALEVRNLLSKTAPGQELAQRAEAVFKQNQGALKRCLSLFTD